MEDPGAFRFVFQLEHGCNFKEAQKKLHLAFHTARCEIDVMIIDAHLKKLKEQVDLVSFVTEVCVYKDHGDATLKKHPGIIVPSKQDAIVVALSYYTKLSKTVSLEAFKNDNSRQQTRDKTKNRLDLAAKIRPAEAAELQVAKTVV